MSAPAVPRDPAELRAQVAEIVGLSLSGVAGDRNLVELGMGSLEMIRLINRWRRAGVDLEYADLAAQPTLDFWWKSLAAYADRPGGRS